MQRRVGERIAELTRNEAAYVTSGAAAGVMLSAAASVLYKHAQAIHQFPNIGTLRHEAIIHHNQRNPFDFAARQIGLRCIEIDGTPTALRAAINDKTACVFWFPRGQRSDKDIPLADVIAIADQYDIPVIVDAAAQLPPVENLWRFSEMGASLAVFSGGKDLRGPQATGLLLGRRDLIELIRSISNPNHGLGRPLKVGKEEMMGLLAAVERYLKLDHNARAQCCEETVRMFCAALNPLPGVRAERAFPNEAGQPLPWCLVTIAPTVLSKSAHDLVADFLEHDPAIAVSPLNETQFHLNPMTLNPGEEVVVRDACLAMLQP